jgi:hypothetical protein
MKYDDILEKLPSEIVDYIYKEMHKSLMKRLCKELQTFVWK